MNCPGEIVIDGSLVADLFIAQPSDQGLKDLLFAFSNSSGGSRAVLARRYNTSPMRRYAYYAQFLLFMAGLILLSACNLPQKSPTATRPVPNPAAGRTPFALQTLQPPSDTLPAGAASTVTPGGQQPAPATAPAATTITQATVYPDSPEGVVQAFVDAYPDDTSAMLQYLSASLKANLPAGGPGELLNVLGDVNGFVILSGSTVPQPPQAEVQGAFQVGAQQALRTFYLVQENGRWVINAIQ